jgi:hypothetical protein
LCLHTLSSLLRCVATHCGMPSVCGT